MALPSTWVVAGETVRTWGAEKGVTMRLRWSMATSTMAVVPGATRMVLGPRDRVAAGAAPTSDGTLSVDSAETWRIPAGASFAANNSARGTDGSSMPGSSAA